MNRSIAAGRALVFAALLAAVAIAPARARAEEDATPAPIKLGTKVPQADVALKNVDGKSLTLAGAAGKKGTLVLFICNHCPWVKAWQSRIAEVGNGALAKGIGVVAINSNDPAAYPEDGFDEMVARAKEVGYKFAYAVDGTSGVAAAFGATHTPEAFLFDAKGKLVYHGAVDDNAHEPGEVKAHWLADAVASVAAGKPVRNAETKALGCGIKYREKSAD